MALLAQKPDEFRSSKSMADPLEVSAAHLAKVMQRLVRQGLVESVSGPRGGFHLRKKPDEIRLMDVYEAIEGAQDYKGCALDEPKCSGQCCILGPMLNKINDITRDYLASTTLSDVAKTFSIAALKP